MLAVEQERLGVEPEPITLTKLLSDNKKTLHEASLVKCGPVWLFTAASQGCRNRGTEAPVHRRAF